MIPELDDATQDIVRLGSTLEGEGHKGSCVRKDQKHQRSENQGKRSIDGVADLLAQMGTAAFAVG